MNTTKPRKSERFGMKRTILTLLAGLVLAATLSACTAFNVNISKLSLGMTPDEVEAAIGKPFCVRAAKLYSEEEWAQVWEYLPPAFTWNPKTYWVYFENDKLVQWGEPGDFSGSSASAVKEYNPNKSSR